MGWRNVPMFIYPIIGLIAGFVTIFIGATGPLIAPFFLRDDLDKEGIDIKDEKGKTTWNYK